MSVLRAHKFMVLHQPEHVSSDQGISMLNAQNSLTAA